MIFEKNVPYIQKVYENLKEQIILNELQQGEQINERDLSEKMQISRTPLRDGLNRLENEGWIERKGNKRFVTSVEWDDIKQIYEARLLIEPYVVKKAAEIVTEADIAGIEEYLSENFGNCRKYDSRYVFMERDFAWHRMIWEKCGNNHLSDELVRLTGHFVRISLLTGWEHDDIATRDHFNLINAIKMNDSDQAFNICKEHINSWFDELNKKVYQKV